MASTAQQRAKRWLEEGKWTVTEQPDPPKEITWMLAAVDEQERGLDIIQYQDVPDVVFMQAAIYLNDEHRKVIDHLDRSTVTELVWDLRIELLKIGVEFHNLNEDFDQSVILTLRIAYDGLTKDTFLMRVSLVRRALLLYTWSIVRFIERHSGVNARVLAND